MAGKPTRPSPFATHRGTMIKRLLIVGVVASVLMMFVSNALEGSRGGSAGSPPTDGPSGTPSASAEAATEPKIAAAVANPMDPYRGVNDAAADESAAPSAEPSDPVRYQRMLTIAQDSAVRFGTYDYRDDPRRWVRTLPNLNPKLRAKLAKEAQQTWPDLDRGQVIARAQLTGQPPQIVYYRERAGSAQLVVFARQQLSGLNGDTTVGRSYVVTMHFDRQKRQWLVNGLTGS